MAGKFLGFDRMHENKFFFLEQGNSFESFWDFFWNISEKTGYFNIGFVFYNVNIQPDIMQNW
jgi:hypothetical protein